ncbi:MAG: hemolysin III family protein [Actinomycetota bacterium]|nr:hemolysin III family protein [Actinomycetota bacterium]
MATAPPPSHIVVPRLRGVSHSVAAVLAVAAATVVVTLAPAGRATIALAVYGGGLVALFTGSAVYHGWPGPVRFKPLLQRIDHSTIYVFIAASYTPIVVIALHGALAWTILAIAWAGAAAGVAFAIGWIHAPGPVVAGSYLALGWVAVIAIPQLVQLASARAARAARFRRPAVLASGQSSSSSSARIRGRVPSASTRSSMPSWLPLPRFSTWRSSAGFCRPRDRPRRAPPAIIP